MKVREFVEDRRCLITNGLNDTKDLTQALDIIERQQEALERARLIIESEDTYYVGNATREAAIEALGLINNALEMEVEG